VSHYGASAFLTVVLSTFGDFINISPFYIAFVLSPILGNATELIASITFASRKRAENTSMSISGLYGSVVMNNTLGLGIFFGLIAFRGLGWTFTAETMTIVLATVCVGLPACFIHNFPLYWLFLNLPVYGLCIVFVWLLQTKAGIL
jgi:Ca2+/Na+ antiporter